ncbi:MAG: hypothetical protein JJ958_14935 [Balneola sp.]|nr:hypothetical protein [Balneola sp.]
MKTDNREFKRYKSIKEKLSFIIDDIEFNQILAIDIALISFKKTVDFKIGFKDYLKFAFKSRSFKKTKLDFESNKLLVSAEIERNDFNSLIESVISGISDKIFSPIYNLKVKRYFNSKNLIISFRHLFIGNKIKNLNFFEKLYLASRLCFYLNSFDSLISEFKDFNFTNKKYLSFNSSFGFEAMLTQFFKANEVPTYTLQHGPYYVKYKIKVPLDNINGENITADNVFVWGRSSLNDLLNNYNLQSSRIIIGGNPKYIAKKIKVKLGFKKCLVLLGRVMYESGNKKILQIVKEVADTTGIKFEVKLHPSLDNVKYKKLCESYDLTLVQTTEHLAQILSRDIYDFAIVNNSTAYYESMYYNLLCFRFEPDENEQFLGLDDKFNDSKSLLNKISSFEEQDSEKLNKNIEKLLTDTLGMGINYYKKYLDG